MLSEYKPLIKNQEGLALTGVAQWIECQPANQNVTSWIPSQGTCLGFRTGQVPSRGCTRGNHKLTFLSLSPSLSLCLKQANKNLFKKLRRD